MQILAAVIGMIGALVVVALRNGNVPLTDLGKTISPQKQTTGPVEGALHLDGMEPQKQAEALLEQAVQHSAVAVDQISIRAAGWPGQVQWTPQIASLSTAALNSDDLRVRQSGVEVELAAYGLTRTPASLDYVLNLTDSTDHAQKVWALWAAGLLANRGVEPEHVVSVLAIHLNDEDVDSRRWATESLALTGTDGSLQLLLAAMHADPSPVIRERATCGIASSGLFTQEQRMTAVPRLISYSEDPSLDAQTHAWVFQALGDITHQQFGNDTASWRHWYEEKVAGGQWSVTVQ
jgi:HEAT repeat protein